MEILKVENLCKTYGKGEAKVNALKNVSFSLEKGEFAAVVGESGSGKSTLLNCIGALDTPTSGSIFIDGQNLFSMKEEKRTIYRRRNIGFIFQSFQLVSELNVEQNIIFPLLLDYQKPDPKKVNEILNLLGLAERRYHLPRQLSGGQQQRVAISQVQQQRNLYYTFAVLVYGFLSIIVAITIFHIMNTINLGVAAKMKEYGSMRAIGMSNRQLIKMIIAEAGTYAISGVIWGCIIGLPMHWVIYVSLITNIWGTAWSVPFIPLILIIAIVLLTSLLAVKGPAKRLQRMSIVENISAQ